MEENYEEVVAIAWFEGYYTERQAQMSSELQGIDFDKVKEFYGRMYAEQEVKSSGVDV